MAYSSIKLARSTKQKNNVIKAKCYLSQAATVTSKIVKTTLRVPKGNI